MPETTEKLVEIVVDIKSVHDGLGNKLAGTIRDARGKVANKPPIHKVSEDVALMLIDADVAHEATAADRKRLSGGKDGKEASA